MSERRPTSTGCAGCKPGDPSLHRITENPDGPDLFDLMRLTEYLRPLVHVYIGQSDEDYDVRVSWTPLQRPGEPNNRRGESVTEGRAHHKGAVYVSPDGTMYDADRNAL